MVILEITLKIKNCLKKNISMISKSLRLTKAISTGTYNLMNRPSGSYNFCEISNRIEFFALPSDNERALN